MNAETAWKEKKFWEKFCVGTLISTNLENLYLVVSENDEIYSFKHMSGGKRKKKIYYLSKNNIIEMLRDGASFYFP